VHEYSLVQALLQRVEEEARRRNATAVRAVKVSIGEMSGVEARFFESAYEMSRPGTLCEAAPLEVVRYRARWACPGCDREFALGDHLRCEACDRPAMLDEKSQSMHLESIEMEVP